MCVQTTLPTPPLINKYQYKEIRKSQSIKEAGRDEGGDRSIHNNSAISVWGDKGRRFIHLRPTELLKDKNVVMLATGQTKIDKGCDSTAGFLNDANTILTRLGINLRRRKESRAVPTGGELPMDLAVLATTTGTEVPFGRHSRRV